MVVKGEFGRLKCNTSTQRAQALALLERLNA